MVLVQLPPLFRPEFTLNGNTIDVLYVPGRIIEDKKVAVRSRARVAFLVSVKQLPMGEGHHSYMGLAS